MRESRKLLIGIKIVTERRELTTADVIAWLVRGQPGQPEGYAIEAAWDAAALKARLAEVENELAKARSRIALIESQLADTHEEIDPA